MNLTLSPETTLNLNPNLNLRPKPEPSAGVEPRLGITGFAGGGGGGGEKRAAKLSGCLGARI